MLDIEREPGTQHAWRFSYRLAGTRFTALLGFEVTRQWYDEVRPLAYAANRTRSEERRVGNESVSTCRSRWSPDHYKKHTTLATSHRYKNTLHNNQRANTHLHTFH